MPKMGLLSAPLTRLGKLPPNTDSADCRRVQLQRLTSRPALPIKVLRGWRSVSPMLNVPEGCLARIAIRSTVC